MVSPYQVQIFRSPDDVALAPVTGALYLSGFSIVTYFGLRLRREALRKAFDKNLLPEVSGPETYADKLTAGTRLTYTTLLPAGTLPAVVATAAGASPGTIQQSLTWMDPEYALAVVPLIFSVPRLNPRWDALSLARPVGVDDILRVLRALAREEVTTSMLEQLLEALESSGIIASDDVLRSVPIADAFGVQLWDLEGSLHSIGGPYRPPEQYGGLEESRRYAWELSAFMSYPIDHIIKDQLWQQRSPDQVFSEIGEGFTVLGDHMVFVNHCCCLEISHLPVKLKERSRFRMQNYGYDSASIFVWTIGNLRAMVLSDLRDRYQERIMQLIDKKGLPADQLVILANEELRHYALIDHLMSFVNQLREARLRLIDEVILRKRFSHDPVGPLRRDMEKAETLAVDLVKARDQELQQNTNTLLAVLAVALAVIGLPGLVEQVGNWWVHGQWQRLCVCVAAVFVVFGLLHLVWRRRRA
jgi:hypothetical protein